MNTALSRRQFLATAGTVAGTTVLAPAVWASKSARPARKKIALIWRLHLQQSPLPLMTTKLKMGLWVAHWVVFLVVHSFCSSN